MNQMTDRKAFATSTAVPMLSQRQMLDLAIAALDELPAMKTFKTIADVEGKTPDQLAQIPITGTPLEPIANKLAAHGQPTETTVGGMMQILGLDKDDMHHLLCECHEHSEEMCAGTAAGQMQDIAGWTKCS